MKNKKNIIIMGAGQLGVLVSNILKRQNIYNIIGFVDSEKRKKNKLVNNLKVLGGDEFLLRNKIKNLNIAIAIGDIKKREKIIKSFKDKNFDFPTIIDPSCNIEKNVKIGKGTIVSTSTTILNNTKLNEFSIIGTAVNILHNVSIENNCIIGGGTTVGSNVHIYKNVFVGVGVTFASKKINIQKNSFVCSGSVVFNSLKEGSKVIGNPARLIPPKSN